MNAHTLDSGVLIWRTQPYSSSVRIICISQLISMSTPGIRFEARWGSHSRTALEAGPDTSAPQSCPGWERSQPSGGKQVNDGSRVEDPAAPRCPGGHFNPEAPKGNPCPGRGHMSHEYHWETSPLAELRAHHTTSPATPSGPSSLTASLAFTRGFPSKRMAFPGFYPSQRLGLQLAAGLPGAHFALENFD